MFKSSLLIAVRTILRQRGYTLINIVGLAIGIACCLLILLFVRDELGYDRFHEKAERIYRVDSSIVDIAFPTCPFRTGPALETRFPEIEAMARFISTEEEIVIEERKYLEKSAFLVDGAVFDLFDLELLTGDPATALVAPMTMVISGDLARKLFGDEDPVGRSVAMRRSKLGVFYIDGPGNEWTVTGVMRPLPKNSHIHPHLLMSMASAERVLPEYWRTTWNEMLCFTYLLLPEGSRVSRLVDQFPQFLESTVGEGVKEKWKMSLMPLTDIHLRSWTSYEIEPSGSIVHVSIFSLIAVIVLVIACINYMNLATARSVNRAREVGIRKALGADRPQLIRQFLSESALLSLMALLVALALTELFLPLFNQLSGKELTLSLISDWTLALWLAALTLLVALLAGSYPAFFLSSFRPVAVLRGVTRTGSITLWLRRILVLAQFSISIALMISVILIYWQTEYLREKDLGIDPDDVMIFPAAMNFDVLKNRLLENPAIVKVTQSSECPATRLDSTSSFSAEGIEPGRIESMRQVAVGHDFFKTLGLEIVEGRSFSEEFGADIESGIILNQAAVKMLGWENPLGKRADIGTWMVDRTVPVNGTVIGVVEDFHFESLHEAIIPVMFVLNPVWYNWTLVKIRGDDPRDAIQYLERTWEELAPDTPFQYSFLADRIAAHYRSEERFFQVMLIFSLLAIAIASLGILGLASFTAEQRTREIGIRKVIGAPALSIVGLLNREYVILIAIATVIATPIALLTMRRWLENFAYRIAITPWPFLLAPLITLAIALVTVSYQSLRAANADPVRALRYE